VPDSSTMPDRRTPQSDGVAAGLPYISPRRERVVGVGEALIRLSTPGRTRLEQAGTLEVTVGGAELNTLIALAQLGHEARFVTRLPDNPLGRRVLEHARRFGVDVSALWETGGRQGLYFVESGAHPRPAEVHYDRARSATAALAPGQVDWAGILAGARALHATGITCALGEGPEDVLAEAFTLARKSKVTTSFDLNHRSRLWSDARAAAAFRRMTPLADVIFASAHDLALVLGHQGDPAVLARELRAQADGPTVVLRDTTHPQPGRVRVQVTVVAATTVTGEPAEAEIVDTFGAGDVAAAAYLHAALAGAAPEAAADLAARACAHMHTVTGDSWVLRAGELDPAYANGRRVLR
jgi:2-dehydro-3-deoxygluconokinase